MTGTWTSVLHHPLLCKTKTRIVFPRVSLECYPAPGHMHEQKLNDGIDIRILTMPPTCQ